MFEISLKKNIQLGFLFPTQEECLHDSPICHYYQHNYGTGKSGTHFSCLCMRLRNDFGENTAPLMILMVRSHFESP